MFGALRKWLRSFSCYCAVVRALLSFSSSAPPGAINATPDGSMYLDLHQTPASILRVNPPGLRVDPAALGPMSVSMETEIRALERCIWDLAESEFNVNSPQQLAEIIFDKMNLAPAGKRSRGKARSTAAAVLAELGSGPEAWGNPMPSLLGA